VAQPALSSCCQRSTLERRGVVALSPSLWFVGRDFQYAFASMLIGGTGRDAG
jgi:putative flavoprotein involved in K+ transport